MILLKEMALRVLLADESSTIKKVFQLALQDFAVEVRPVNIGVDVAMVAKGFKPDIIFADVMLQKKNGYDVCAEMKQDAALKGIPFVLMWSGFVELDEDKFQASHANAQLEKPFDVAALRKLVSDLVPRTQGQSLAEYLTFPKATVEATKPAAPPPEAKPEAADEDFKQVSIPKMKGTQSATDKYRLNLKPEELDPSHIAVEFDAPANTGSIDVDNIFKSADKEPDEFTMRESKKPAEKGMAKATSMPPPLPANEPPPLNAHAEIDLEDESNEFVPVQAKSAPKPGKAPLRAPPAPAAVSNGGALSADQLEKIIREQSAEVIESVVWKVIPELAAQIIERELNKLLKERDANPF
jgi:two-component system cell cycle response regulator